MSSGIKQCCAFGRHCVIANLRVGDRSRDDWTEIQELDWFVGANVSPCGVVKPQSLHSLFRLQGEGFLAPPLFGRLQWYLSFFGLLRGHFRVFTMKSSAGGLGSYAFGECFCANINSKWQFSKCGSI
jgi:hypothetical protein